MFEHASTLVRQQNQRHARARPRRALGAALVAALVGTVVSGLVMTSLAAASSPGAAGSSNCSAPNVICITEDLPSRLEITTSNVVYDGQGHSAPGARVLADDVVLKNFKFTNCAGWCVWLHGRRNVLRDNDISQVRWAPEVSDDIDAVRFFGDGTEILNNNVHDILVGDDEHDAHLDCMQTYATPRAGGGSSHVVISGNVCDDQHFHQCVMAEGPNSTDGGGGGGGVSKNWTIDHNWFACYANQTIKLDDIHNVNVVFNTFAGAGRKAIAIGEFSTHIRPKHNILGPGYSMLIGD